MRRVCVLAWGFLLLGVLPPGCKQRVSKPVRSATRPTQAAPAAPLAITDRIDAGAGVTVARLSNGLTVIVKPTHAAPVVCVKAFVRAGSLYERQWLGSGISHLAEHLVAEDASHGHEGAAPGGGQAEVRNRVTEIGGQSNASTSLGWTRYYISASAGKVNPCIDLIADWMHDPADKITEEAFRREHGVVQRELEMRTDDPNRQLWMSHAANVFGPHPAALPVLGYAGPLRGLTLQDVRAYVRRMYVPQNIVFCVVGDVAVEPVLARIRKALAGSQAGRLPDLSLPAVRRFSGVRRVTRRHKDLKETMEIVSFQTVPLLHEDLHALDVLSYVLTQGPSSRLVQRIQREQKLVTGIESYSWTPAWGRGEFAISFRAACENADAAEKAILDELRRVVAEGVTAEQLQRAQRQKVADYVYSQQSAEDIADTLAADYLTTGDVAFSRGYTDRIQQVTRAQVQEAAKRYFTFNRMAVTRLVPQEKPSATAPATRATTAKAQTQFFKLPSGLRVVLQPNDAVGLVSMAFVTEGGVLCEDEKTNGLGALMTALSTKGAGGRSAEQIARFFDSAGGAVTGNCGNNTFYWQATVLKDSFPEALDIFADIVVRPTFPEKELEILRPEMLTAVKKVDENWEPQLQKFFRGRFYVGPYSLLAVGREEVIRQASAEGMHEHHRAYVRGRSGVLAAFGNFDPVAARRQIERSFAVAAKAGAMPDAAQRDIAHNGELHVLETTHQTAGVIVAVQGMKITNEDRYAITVLDTIISGYYLPTGWLHDQLRGKRLVYMVHAYNWAGLQPGAFVVEAACQPEKVPEVVRIIEENLRKAAAYQPTHKEIDRAVTSIVTADLLGNQSMSALAMSAALDELYGFGYDFRSKLEARYRRVTPQDVQRVAKKYLTRPHVVVVTTPRPDLARREIPKIFQGRPAPKPRNDPNDRAE